MSKVTFTSTGSEAVHLACRIARARTGKKLIAKAIGGYDGWFDEFRYGLADSPESREGNERPIKGDFALMKINDTADLEFLFRDYGGDLAAIIVEPVLGNAGSLVPSKDYFAEINRLSRKYGTLIIADEVMVGLRLGLKPVSEVLGLVPDLMTMGKAIGSGLPVAAVLGTPETFEVVENGKVVCYGTYQGNPLVTAAVNATLDYFSAADFQALLKYGAGLQKMIVEAFQANGIKLTVSGLPTIFSYWFSERAPANYAEAASLVQRDVSRFLYEQLRRQGVITIPSPWGRIFFSFAHGSQEFEIATNAFDRAAGAVKRSGLMRDVA